MKSSKLLLALCGRACSSRARWAQAASVTGTVTNKTTGKPAAGDTVVLVDVQAGMSEVAKPPPTRRATTRSTSPAAAPTWSA